MLRELKGKYLYHQSVHTSRRNILAIIVTLANYVAMTVAAYAAVRTTGPIGRQHTKNAKKVTAVYMKFAVR